MPDKCDPVTWDENGLAQSSGLVEAARIDQRTGIWLGNETIPAYEGFGLPPDYILDLPPREELPFSYGWGRIQGKWEYVQLPAPWEIPTRYILERIPPLPERYSIGMWEKRLASWMRAGNPQSNKKISFKGEFINRIMIDIQGLGYSEEKILQFEVKILNFSEDNISLYLKFHSELNSYFSDSKHWILSLYEVMRVLRNNCKISFTDKKHEAEFEELFYEVELIRMPLATHEARQRKGCEFSPDIFLNMDTHQFGWWTIDFNPEKLPRFAPEGSYRVVPVFRRELADKFISIFS